MKTIKITEEQHDQLRTYSFFNKITIQQIVSIAISEYVEKCNSVKVDEYDSVEVDKELDRILQIKNIK